MSNIVSFPANRGLAMSIIRNDSSLIVNGSYKGKIKTDVYRYVGLDAIQYSEAECEMVDFGQDPELGIWALGQIANYLLDIGICKILAGDNNGGLSFTRQGDDIIFNGYTREHPDGVKFSMRDAMSKAEHV